MPHAAVHGAVHLNSGLWTSGCCRPAWQRQVHATCSDSVSSPPQLRPVDLWLLQASLAEAGACHMQRFSEQSTSTQACGPLAAAGQPGQRRVHATCSS